MAQRKPASTVLMSIRPAFALLIMDGSKTVEFRKRPFHEDVRDVIVYASRPISAVVGRFRVASIDVDVKTNLWQRYGVNGAVKRDWFRHYYRNSSTGVAIKVGDVRPLAHPMPLKALGIDAKPPQSFMYVDDKVSRFLRAA